MIDIEIDGHVLQVEQNTTIMEAADKKGIYIPRFCYHKKLSIAANCRMCLVEVEKSGKPLPACATPVTAGMKVFTASQMAKEAQRSVMEFLLINHPLDCPICDQGGECELQDLSLIYGQSLGRFTEAKRAVRDDDFGPLISTEMTRCIHCTRCVRFSQEIAGVKEIGTIHRGEDLQISTYIKHSLKSELSGNIIDLCPVGALISKPFRFTARAWELDQVASVAPHDCLGSNIYLHTRRGRVLRAVPRENEAVNETWLSDRDRYSYLGVHSKERLTKPQIKKRGQWYVVDWDRALEKIVLDLKRILTKHTPAQIGALASPSSTTEEFYYLQKLWRGLGSHNLDHRLHQSDFSDQSDASICPPSLSPEEIEKASFILLIGSNIQREQPLLAYRVRKAFLAGSKIASINCFAIECSFPLEEQIVISPNEIVLTLAAILGEFVDSSQKLSFSKSRPNPWKTSLTKAFENATHPLIILGSVAQNHPEAALIRQLAGLISQKTNARCVYLTEGANSMGAWLAGVVPHRLPCGVTNTEPGLTAAAMFEQGLKAYFFLHIEPTLDCANPQLVSHALRRADCVVAFSAFKTKDLLEYADILLPVTSFAETRGSFINMAGTWQAFLEAVPPVGEAQSACLCLQKLGRLLALRDFDHSDQSFIREKLGPSLERHKANPNSFDINPEKVFINFKNKKVWPKKLMRISEWPLYRIDSLVRRSEALQQAAVAYDPVAVSMNARLAASLKLKPGIVVRVKQSEGTALLPLSINERIPNDCVYVPSTYEETSSLGESFGAIDIYVQ